MKEKKKDLYKTARFYLCVCVWKGPSPSLRESLVPSNSIDCFKNLSCGRVAINKETGRTMGVIVRGFLGEKTLDGGLKTIERTCALLAVC